MKTILLSAAIVLSMFQLIFAQSCDDITALPEAVSDEIAAASACTNCDDILGQLSEALGDPADPAFLKEANKVAAECKKYMDTVIKDFQKNTATYKKEADAAKVKCDACAEAMASVLAPALSLPDDLALCAGECSTTALTDATTAAAAAISAAKTAVDAYKCESIAMPYTKEFEKFLADEAKRQLKKVQTAVKALTDTLKKQVAADKKKATECVKTKLTPVLKTVKSFKCP